MHNRPIAIILSTATNIVTNSCIRHQLEIVSVMLRMGIVTKMGLFLLDGYMKRRKWRTVSRISQLSVARVLQRKKKEKKNLSEK